MAQFHSFLWLSNIPLYMCTTSSLSILLSMDIQVASMFRLLKIVLQRTAKPAKDFQLSSPSRAPCLFLDTSDSQILDPNRPNTPSFSWWHSQVCVCVLAAQTCPTVRDPKYSRLRVSTVQGILQVQILEWVAISFSRGSSLPRDWTRVSCIAGRFLTIWATREAHSQVM